MNGTEPPELRIGHMLLDPGNPREEEPPRMWVVFGYEGRGLETVKVKASGFGEEETRKLSARRIPPGWLFVHGELLAGLLSRHAASIEESKTMVNGCAVCAVFGGPGTVETIQKAGH